MSDARLSFVYRNIYIYRLVMNLLYGFRYTDRFRDCSNLFRDSDRSVLELCFGDLYIAEFCRKSGRAWHGIDINAGFVRMAVAKGFDARCADLFSIEEYPRADLCVMAGSLYHFQPVMDDLFDRIFRSTNRLILSEPVKNLSSAGGVIGFLARRSANAGKGDEMKRFTAETLRVELDRLSKKYKFSWKVAREGRDMVVEIEK